MRKMRIDEENTTLKAEKARYCHFGEWVDTRRYLGVVNLDIMTKAKEDLG